MALGSPSGTKILTCVTQVILNKIEYGMDLWDAVSSVRYHHQWRPKQIRVDELGFPKDTHKKLEKMGHEINHKDLGCKIQAITYEGKGLRGVSDPRGEGMAKGI